ATIAYFLYRGGSATIAYFLYRGGSATIAYFLYRGAVPAIFATTENIPTST
ncbi:hypothetical protein ABX32_005587, partial [Escherichia coli]|nr:hypothetical protein [Escherichia coli]